MKREAPRKKSNRIEKFNSLVQHLLGPILLPYLKNQRGIATITKVQTSADLRHAKIFISVVGEERENDVVLNTLRNNIYEIQGELNREVETKIIPRLTFHLDTSGRYAQHIEEIFKKIEEEKNEGK